MIDNLKKAILIFLIMGAFGFYTASILTMRHEDGNMVNCSSETAQATQTQDPASCLSYHLGLIHNLSEIPSLRLDFQILVLSLAAVVLFAIFSLVSLIENFYSRLKLRCRWLFQKALQIFFVQLGFWLTLFEKRDPSFAFA